MSAIEDHWLRLEAGLPFPQDKATRRSVRCIFYAGAAAVYDEMARLTSASDAELDRSIKAMAADLENFATEAGIVLPGRRQPRKEQS